MKGLVLAIGMSAAYLVVLTLIFRCWRIQARAAVMTCLYLLTLPVFLVLHLLTPADLGFLPGSLTEPHPLVDLVFGLLLWTAAFFGGILQLYNLADRGFSLRIIMDIERGKDGAMSVDDVLAAYSDGRGIGWMYQKRLDDLVRHRLARIEGGWISNRRKGRRLALLFGWLRRFLQLDPVTKD
jgi:hypothetical protein